MERSGYVNRFNIRGNLYFTCGLPHSGKSTFCNEWANSVGDKPKVVLAGDDFRLAMTGHVYLPHAEAHIFAVLDTAALALLNRGYDVLIDETATSDATVMRYLRLDINATPIFIKTPPEECKKRAILAGREYLLPVIDRLTPQFNRMFHNWQTIIPVLKAKVEHRLDKKHTFVVGQNEQSNNDNSTQFPA